MQTYLVRVSPPDALVGIFFAKSAVDLFFLVEEFACDPMICEYRVLDASSALLIDSKKPIIAGHEKAAKSGCSRPKWD
jgi:hypothetical protein